MPVWGVAVCKGHGKTCYASLRCVYGG